MPHGSFEWGNSTPNSSIDSQKYDELQNAFEELHEELENFGGKYISLKKNFSMLLNELKDLKIQNDLLKKENEALSELKSQNDSFRKVKEELSSKDFSSNDLKKEMMTWEKKWKIWLKLWQNSLLRNKI